jgi:hypothetical protein
MLRSMLALGGLLGALALVSLGPLRAAEMPVPTDVTQAPNLVPNDCGPCGCLSVTYVDHRELRSTYGLNYDPRNYDTTEPQFYFGPVRSYPRYFVDGVPVPGSCRD